MRKTAPNARLLRSLNRAAKSQQSLLVKLWDAFAPAPAPVKALRTSPARRAAPPAVPSKARPAVLPGLAPASGTWLALQYPLPSGPGPAVGQTMVYHLYLPRHVPASVARHGWPLVVMLHGCQQSATQFAHGTRMNRLAEEKGYAVLYPQQLASVQAQRCWRWYDRATQEGDGDTVVLAALIATVCAQHAVDRRRVYACGLSAGAGMAAVLALNHPELIAAVGLHSAPVFGAGHSQMGALHVMRHGAQSQADAAIAGVLARRAMQAVPMPPMPALMIQGEDDPVVRPVNQQQLAHQWLQLNGLPAAPATRVTVKPAARNRSGLDQHAHVIHDFWLGSKVLLRVARVTGLHHAWSGGDPALPFNAPAGPDASRMMLAFFGKHRR